MVIESCMTSVISHAWLISVVVKLDHVPTIRINNGRRRGVDVVRKETHTLSKLQTPSTFGQLSSTHALFAVLYAPKTQDLSIVQH